MNTLSSLSLRALQKWNFMSQKQQQQQKKKTFPLTKQPLSVYPLQQPLRVRPAKYSQHRTAMPRMWEPLSDLRRMIMGKCPTVKKGIIHSDTESWRIETNHYHI